MITYLILTTKAMQEFLDWHVEKTDIGEKVEQETSWYLHSISLTFKNNRNTFKTFKNFATKIVFSV